MSTERDVALIEELKRLPAETSWFEFKSNNKDPVMIGRLASALSNRFVSPTSLTTSCFGGLEDGSHQIVGTDFDLRFWLRSCSEAAA